MWIKKWEYVNTYTIKTIKKCIYIIKKKIQIYLLLYWPVMGFDVVGHSIIE